MNMPEKHDATVNIDLAKLESKLRDYCAGLVAMSAGYDASRYDTPSHRIRVEGEWVDTTIGAAIYGDDFEADLVLLRQNTASETRWYVVRRYNSRIDLTVEQHYYIAAEGQKPAVLAQALSTSMQ